MPLDRKKLYVSLLFNDLRLVSRVNDHDVPTAGLHCSNEGKKLLELVWSITEFGIQALVQEKHREWEEKFEKNLHLQCRELTGDSGVRLHFCIHGS